jgi:virulence factor Mce-like protein
MVTQAPRRGQVLAALVFIAASIGLTFFVWTSVGGRLPLSARGYRVHVLFANASTLASNADVRMAGVDVGKVIGVRQRGVRTEATLELAPQYAPLASDARAVLRLKSLLGETFVAMTPGSRRAARIPDGGWLATRQVAATQPLDRVLGMLDARTRRDLDALISSGAAALDVRGADLNAALGNLDPVSAQLAAITQVLDAQRPQLGALTRDAGTVLQTAALHGDGLRRLISAGDRLAAQTARRDAALGATTRALPGLLAQLRATSVATLQTATDARPVLRALRRAAPDAEPALRSLGGLAPQAADLLTRLRRALPTVRRALPAAAHFTSSVVPLIETLYPAAREIVPIITLVSAYRREITATVANVGAATQATAPGLGGTPVHYLRSLVPITEESIMGYKQRLASNRHNAYHAPGELDQLLHGGLQASNCANAFNPQTLPVIGTGAPPCRQQPPWPFNGRTQLFPHVEREAATR